MPDDTSRGKPQATSSGAQSSGSAAANPDTVEIDGVHVSTTGVPRIQTEETVGEHFNLTEDERLDLHERKEFVDILEKFTKGFMDLDNIAKNGWFDRIKADFKSIDDYAERIVEQCGDVLRGAKFMDGNYMMIKHLVVLLMRELLRIEHFFASQDLGTVNERTKYWRVNSLRDFHSAFNTLASIITTSDELEQMTYLSKLAGIDRCVAIGDSFVTVPYHDPVTGLSNQTIPEYDVFIGSGNAKIMSHLPAGKKIGPIEATGTYGTCGGKVGICVCAEGTIWVPGRSRPLDSWFPITVNNLCLVQILPQTHTSAFLSGDIDPWETAGDLVPEPEPETIDTTGAAAAAAETEEEEDDDDPWDGHSLVSSSAPDYGCRASTSDDDDGDEDYAPFTAEELNEKDQSTRRKAKA